MKHKLLPLILGALVLSGCGRYELTKITGGADIDPFSFTGNSVVPELAIDGKRDEEQWTQGEYTTMEYTFTYKNYLSKLPYQYSFTVYRGERELFVFYKVFDCNIVTYGNDNGSSVSYSDSCELYLDTQLNGGQKPQTDDYQIDLGVHGKTRMLVGNGSGWSTWSGIVQYETYMEGTMNDEMDIDNFYCIEMAIPYKQIGITREQEIGVTFGIVDRYEEAGASTNKMWYGTTYAGHYGNPQVPSTYFILGKNEIKVPPVPEYEPSEDQTQYATTTATIEGSVCDGDTFEEITFKISKKDNIITCLSTTEEKWPEREGICLLFDFDDQVRGTRDENTIILRGYPGARSIKDFYKYPNIGLSKSTLNVKIDDHSLFVSFDISKYVVEGYTSVNFCGSSISMDGQVTQKVMKIGEHKMNQSDIATWAKVTKDNVVEIPEKGKPYDIDDDATEYIAGTDITIPNVQVGDIDLGEHTIKAARDENKVTVLVHNEIDWVSNEELMICLDLGKADRTARDGSTLILRCYPELNSIEGYFMFPNVSTPRTSLRVYYYKQDIKIIVDISTIVQGINEYVDEGVGFACAVMNATGHAVLQYCYVGTQELKTNPSEWPRLGANNTILGE